MVTLVTFGAQTSNFCIILELLILCIFRIFERTGDFYELFCEGLSALRKYALMAVRGLKGERELCADVCVSTPDCSLVLATPC